MKNIFKINPITYFILGSMILCGYFNYFLIISFILFVHDLGHILLMKVYKIEIYKIDILPFGSVIETNVNYNIPSYKLFWISLVGVLFQVLIYPCFYFLYKWGFINDISYNIFIFYNKLIIIFNLLPLIPLDGSKILLSLVETIFPYKISLKLLNSISILGTLLFVIFNKITLNVLLICLFIFLRTYTEILNHKLIFNKFLLERCLYNLNFKKVKYINNINKMYKNKFNIINNQREDKYLKERFKYV